MGFVGETVDSIKFLQIHQVLNQGVSLGMIVTSALIIWKALMCITGSESPVVVVVLSGGMDSGFRRGDILFLHMSKDPIRADASAGGHLCLMLISNKYLTTGRYRVDASFSPCSFYRGFERSFGDRIDKEAYRHLQEMSCILPVLVILSCVKTSFLFQ